MIFLGAALLCVPVSKRLGIGSVLGYLLAGILVGPFVLGWVGQEGEDIMHTSEFGVVMMLFLTGLELNPSTFWKMRKLVLGMGGFQIVGTTLLLLPILHWLFELPFAAALSVALAFAMSSTAIVLQTLKEKSLDKTQAGQSSFAVLLFQDIAVIPVMALLPLLAGSHAVVSTHGSANDGFGWAHEYPTLTIAGAVLAIVLLSKFAINPFLHLISRMHMRELFTAAALFIVVSVSWLMQQVGISPALGAFMAGVLLANSEFRHELESDIAPFKGLLLGLFFTAVGSTINFELIAADPLQILMLVFVVMVMKGLVLYGLGKLFKLHTSQNVLFALVLSQVGEFAFVLLGAAGQLQLLEKNALDLMMAVVTLSMMLTPILLLFHDRVLSKWTGVKESETPAYEVQADQENEVIIAGFGHFGSTVGRFLRANGVEATILDSDSDRVLLLRKMGFKVYYGDATRVDLLEAAGAGKAKLLLAAIDGPEKNMELVDQVKKHFPNLKVYMRARNRYDAYELMELGVTNIYRESLHASVYMGVDVLHQLGQRKYTLQRKANDFIRYDEEALVKLAESRTDDDDYIVKVREAIALQEQLLKEDMRFMQHQQDMAWDNSPMRN